jgi:predicted DNA-binding WGR domain protein
MSFYGEFHEGSSNKYYRLVLAAGTSTVSAEWGSTVPGAPSGTTQVKKFDTREEAEEHFERARKDKVKKGYKTL